jgi:hypothetical protein
VLADSEESLRLVYSHLVRLAKGLHRPSPNNSNKQELMHHHDWAKVVVTLLDYSTDWLDSDMSARMLAEEAERIFEATKSIKLQLVTLAMLYRFASDDPLYSERTAQKGLSLALEYGLEKFKMEFERMLKSTIDSIQNLYHNKITFLKSSPLRLKATGSRFPVLSTDLRNPMFRLLDNWEKEVAFYYGLLTKQSFIDLHRRFSGCKVLVIDFFLVSSLGVEFESDGFNVELFTYDELEEIPNLLGDDFGPNIDVVIILNKEGNNSIDFFKHFQIKHFIYFNFDDFEALVAESPSPADYLLPFWVERLKETFVSLFLEELPRNVGRDLHGYLKLVQAESVDLVNHMIRDCKYYQCQVNHWKTDSLEAEKDLQFLTNNVVFTGESGKFVVSEFKKGQLNDISPFHARIESPQVFLSLDSEILQIYELLSQGKTTWVNLWGEYGVGKTFFVKLLEYELKIRNIFPDGIYNFNLREMDQAKSIRKQMVTVLGIDFLVDTHEFFKNKKMLIIFDGYERVLSTLLQTPVSLLEAMRENNIYVLFITEPDENGKVREVPDSTPFKLERLSDYESMQYLLSMIAHNFTTFLTFRRDSLDKFAHSSMVRDCRGRPMTLSKNASKIFRDGLGIKLEASRAYKARTQMYSPGLNKKFSMLTEHEIHSDGEDDLKSHTSVYHSEVSSKDKKSLNMSKLKPKNDCKKDGKQPKNRTKKKLKKEMH